MPRMKHGVKYHLEEWKNPRSDFLQEFEMFSTSDIASEENNSETGNGNWKL